MWTGLMLGTALAVLAMMNGVRLKIGGTPPFLGWILGGMLVWLLVVLAATAVAEVLRRHHRTIGRYAGRQASRGARHGLGLARRHGSRGLHAAGGWAGNRWQARQAGPRRAREPVDLGGVLRPSRWRRRQAVTGSRPAPGERPLADPDPTPADGLPVVSGWRSARDGTLPAEVDDVVASGDGPATDAGGAWGDPDPAGDYGTGPWILGVRRRDGQPYYGGPDGSPVGTTLVRTPDDLRRRLKTASADPDTEVRVGPAKVTDPDLVPPALDPALEQDIRRQACELHAADGLEPGEVIVSPDGAVTIDRRRNSRGAYPQARPVTGTRRWSAQPGGGARVVDLYPVTGRPTDPAGGALPPADSENQHGGTDMSTGTTTYLPPADNAWAAANARQHHTEGAAAGSGLPRRTARTAAAPEPNGVWRSLISSTNGFEPENDGHLLGWMAGEAGGMSGYAEEIADVYETAVNTIGLDPVAMAALHDYADAAAEAAESMAKARQRFADHYSEVRAFAANGGVLPYNGRWMTGEGD